MNATIRYQHLSQQHAYQRAVAARGLSALLAPYSTRRVFLPAQRVAGDVAVKVA